MLDRSPTPQNNSKDDVAPAASKNPLLPLETKKLRLDIDGKRLIDDIDLRLVAADLTVVMGQNGAGKSLLLRLLHGLIAPPAGEVIWGGEVMGDPIRRRQAM
jgi:tungstate transport system ATP-binding protein